MNKQELLDVLALHRDQSASLWGQALADEAANGPLHALTISAENSAIGFRLTIADIDKEAIDIPGALYDLGGAAHLETQRGVTGGPAALALVALATYASETHLEADVAAGAGAVDVAGAGGPEAGSDIGAGTGEVSVAGAGAVQGGADVAAGEGVVV